MEFKIRGIEMGNNFLINKNSQMLRSLETLAQPVTSLNGVTAEAAKELGKLGITTVQDLAASSIFTTASQIAEASNPIIRPGDKRQISALPTDLLKKEVAGTSIEKLANEPISIFTIVSEKDVQKIESTLGTRTVCDLAKWPPYLLAKDILTAETGGVEPSSVEDPEAPSDLVPGTGRYPTERIQYEIIVLDKILKGSQGQATKPGAAHSIPPQVDGVDIGSIGRNVGDGILGPSRDVTTEHAIEQDFNPLDVSQYADAGFTRPAIGAVLTYSQSWYTMGLTLGHLLHSVALSPGETTRIAIVDWNRREKASGTEQINETEALTASLEHNRSISEITNAVASEAQTGFSQAINEETTFSGGSGTGVSGQIMGFFGVAGASIGGSAGKSTSKSFTTSRGTRNLNAQMTQNICDSTQQAANSVRNRRASIVREVSQSESETLSTRAITNFNHMHALTIQYYEVVQLYRIVVELNKVTRCLFLPMKILDFSNLDVITRFRSILRQAAFSQEARDLLVDDFSVQIKGLRNPNGLTNKQQVKEAAWLKEARLNSHLELTRGPLDNTEWYVPRLVGLQAYDFTWPKEVKARCQIHTDDGSVKDSGICENSGTYNAGRGVLWSLSEFTSFEITLEKDQSEDVKLPIEVEILLELDYSGRKFLYRHVVEVYDLGKSVPLVTIKPAPSDDLAVSHLQENALYYSQVIWKNMSGPALVALLESSGYTFQGQPITEVIDPTPFAVTGNYVAYRFYNEDDEQWEKFLDSHPDLRYNKEYYDQRKIDKIYRQEEYVPVPSGGVWAEAVLGRFNSAEKLDITRFWNWQDSPIPITAPEIAPLQAKTPTADQPSLTASQLGQPVINLVNAPALPDPTGMSAVLNSISNGAMFRDMSHAAETLAAANAALASGFTAAGQSQQIAKDYAQIAADLMAKKGLGANSGGSNGSSASGSSNSSNGYKPSNVSELGAKYNAATALDKESAKSGSATKGSNNSTSGSNSNASAGTTSSVGSSNAASDTSTIRRDQVMGTEPLKMLADMVYGTASSNDISQIDNAEIDWARQHPEGHVEPGVFEGRVYQDILSLWNFDVGSSDITKFEVDLWDYIRMLKEWANLGDTLIITGHASSSGSEEINSTLARKRALNVKDWLVNKGELNETSISIVPLGTSFPIPDSLIFDPEARARERRVEIRRNRRSWAQNDYDRALNIVQNMPDSERKRRLQGVIPILINQSGDDRYIDKAGLGTAYSFYSKPGFEWLDDVGQWDKNSPKIIFSARDNWVNKIHPGYSDDEILSILLSMDTRIWEAIQWVAEQEARHQEGGLSILIVEAKKWISLQQSDANSIYFYYK
jgi:outer membrane protein OmpA-like peptidoglycan-associated protein